MTHSLDIPRSHQPLATTTLLSVSVDSLILAASWKWVHTICEILKLVAFLDSTFIHMVAFHFFLSLDNIPPCAEPTYFSVLICLDAVPVNICGQVFV